MYKLLASILLTLTALCGVSISQVYAKKSDPNQVYYQQFQEIFERIDKDYVQEPDHQKMVDAAIRGMLNSLDPHSNYFVGEEVQDFLEQTKGEFGGVGIEIIYDNDAVKVISPIDDLPAYRAGIKAGDYIVGVNGDLVSTLGFNKAVKEMRGKPGTKVTLLVVGEEDSKPRKVEITREIVKITPVKGHLEEGNIAYIRIVTFNENTTSKLKDTMNKLKAESKEGIKGIILDLRNNPGGLLEQAVNVSEYFIESGVIVSTSGRVKSSVNKYNASRFTTKAPNVPMVVIINSGSASASEIVAGALQDHKRAIILGTKSFGKGSVQTFVKFNDGKEPKKAVKMTTAKYYTPNGRSIQAEGIEPDIIIEPAKVEYAESDNNLLKRFSESSLKNYLKNEKENSDKSISKELEEKDKKSDTKTKDTLTKEQKKDTKNDGTEKKAEFSDFYKSDYQFARAYDVIRALILSEKK